MRGYDHDEKAAFAGTALHVIAVCQIRHPGLGRDYDDRKLAEGKTKKEALRALKRQVSNVVWRHLVYDADRNRCS